MKANEILKSNLNDLIFEYRNKKYGAYHLRKLYENHIKISLGIVLLSCILIYCSFKLIPKKIIIKETYAIPVNFESEPKFKEKEKKVEPNNAKAKKVKTEVFTEIKPIEDHKIEEEQNLATKDELKDANIGNISIKDGDQPTGSVSDGTQDVDGELEVKKEEIIVEKPVEKVFDIAEVNPSYIGGVEAMMKFLSKNIYYPIYGRENNIEGKVIVQFIVDEHGNITNPKILRGMGGEFDENAIAAIKKMPKWNPGLQHGKPVKVKFTIPIIYNLNK